MNEVMTRRMNARMILKKAVITATANVPGLKRLKDDSMAGLRNALRIPHQKGFRCIPLLAPSESSVFLDIGANSGQSIDSIRLFAPRSPIVSFEPNPILVTYLRDRFRTDPHLQVECLAIGAQPGEFDLFVPSYRSQYFPDLASLDPVAVAKWLPDRIWGFRPQHHRVEKVKCKVSRLDDLKLEPFLIKIDVCCLQSAVIRGALRMIDAHKPFLILSHAADVQECHDLLAPFGYQAFVYENGRFRRVTAYSGEACLIPDEKRAKMPAHCFTN